jgi:hypothetical protein
MAATESRRRGRALCVAAGLLCLAGAAVAQANSGGAGRNAAPDAWQFGAVLDIGYSSRELALGGRSKGLQLGHSDFSAGGPLGSMLRAQVTAVASTHDGKAEAELEEAWLESTRLPWGLSLRAGRFASQIGYLNAQHLHADDFSERPLLYRGFFGQHWNDDGLRLNWVAPAPIYVMLGVEAFHGRGLVHEAAGAHRKPGITTAVLKFGADVGREHSWQLGLSHIRSRRVAAMEEHHGHEGEEGEEHEEAGEEHEHEHEHGARYTGRKTAMVDFTWKWAPGGNNRERQLRLSVEAARISGIAGLPSAATHRAQAVAVVWRFHPSWEVGWREDRLRASIAHEGELETARLKERSLMLAWKPSHMQTLRLQASAQGGAQEIEGAAKRVWQLQYVLGFGAHGAHSF